MRRKTVIQFYMMDKKTKLLLVFILVLSCISISALFYKSMVLQDFVIEEPVLD